MKKHLTFLPALLLAGLLANGQVQFGFKGGLHYSDASAETRYGEKLNVRGSGGIHLGVQAKIAFDKDVFFVPQLQYAYKNFTVDYANTDTASIQMNMHYMEFPLLLEYNRIRNHKGFFFQFGPSFSLALAGNQTITGKTGNSGEEPIKYAFNAYGRMEANLVANAGYQFNRSMGFSVGYAQGLGTIVDSDQGPSIIPRMFTASLHYWPFKTKQ